MSKADRAEIIKRILALPPAKLEALINMWEQYEKA